MQWNNFGPFQFARMGQNAVRELTQGLDKFVAGRLWVKILISLFLGLIFGFILGPETQLIPQQWAHTLIAWLAFPGQLFLGLIRLVVIPLVFASIILGIVSSESVQQLKQLGLKLGVYYICTTVISAGVGLLVVYILKPGLLIDPKNIQSSDINTSSPAESEFKIKSIGNIFTDLISDNPFNVLVTGEMLQVVLLAMFTGVALMSLKNNEAKPLIDLLNSFQKISMIVIGWAMSLAPLAVFGLTTHLIAQLGLNILIGLSYYIFTVVFGLALINIFYLILIQFIAKESPFLFMKQIKDIQLLAFSTSSSASVMPMTIETAEKKLFIKPHISQFVIPMGTTVNMDGTAMYQCMATVFLAQVFGVDLSLGQLGLVVLTATLSSIGAPGAPGVGMAILSSILGSVGIPPTGIVLILGVDRILDMCRTVINVTGDLTAALIMDRTNNS